MERHFDLSDIVLTVDSSLDLDTTPLLSLPYLVLLVNWLIIKHSCKPIAVDSSKTIMVLSLEFEDDGCGFEEVTDKNYTVSESASSVCRWRLGKFVSIASNNHSCIFERVEESMKLLAAEDQSMLRMPSANSSCWRDDVEECPCAMVKKPLLFWKKEEVDVAVLDIENASSLQPRWWML